MGGRPKDIPILRRRTSTDEEEPPMRSRDPNKDVGGRGHPPVHEEKGSGRPPPPLDKGMLPFSRKRTAAIFVPRRTRRRTDASLGGRPLRLGDSPDEGTVERSARAPSFGPKEE